MRIIRISDHEKPLEIMRTKQEGTTLHSFISQPYNRGRDSVYGALFLNSQIGVVQITILRHLMVRKLASALPRRSNCLR